MYEFMRRGSLEDHLFKRSSYIKPLSWSRRIKIALGSAKGLAFLHSPEIKVIYRDLTPANSDMKRSSNRPKSSLNKSHREQMVANDNCGVETTKMSDMRLSVEPETVCS